MAFWDAVDRFVGYIPVTSTVKDAIEAGIAEAKGLYGAAKEDVIEAAVMIVSDLVTVTAFGASAEVATAGAIAAEGVFKQAAKGVVQNLAAEATSLGSGRKADDDVTAVAATQYAREIVGFEEAKGHHGAAIAIGASAEVVEAGKTAVEWFLKYAAKDDLKTAAEAMFLGSGLNAADVVLTAAAASQYARQIMSSKKWRRSAQPPSKEPSKDPKRGHHVINNGVIKIIPKIIKTFLEEFVGSSYQELVDQNIITSGATPTLMSMFNQPLPPNVCAQIEQMVADTPSGETHTDQNAVQFGFFNLALIKAVRDIVFHVFGSLERFGKMPDLNRRFLDQMIHLTNLINKNTTATVYVDHQALQWWLNESGCRRKKMEEFTTCIDSVKSMFDSLVCEENPYDGIACILGREIFQIHVRLIERYNP